MARALGVSPDKSWRTGEPRAPGAALLHKRNGLHVSSGCKQETELEEHLLQLGALLGGVSGRIAEAARELDLDTLVAFAVYYDPEIDSTPAIEVSPATMDAFTRCRAGLSVDLIHFDSLRSGLRCSLTPESTHDRVISRHIAGFGLNGQLDRTGPPT